MRFSKRGDRWVLVQFSKCDGWAQMPLVTQVGLSEPKLRHLFTSLLWGGWYGIEALLHWPDRLLDLNCTIVGE